MPDLEPAVPDQPPVNPQRLAMEVGARETRDTLALWWKGRFKVVVAWLAGSLLIAIALLFCAWLFSLHAVPTGYSGLLVAIDPRADRDDFLFISFRNLVVLLMHLLVCFATYLARRSLPMQAEHMTGVNRWVHHHMSSVSMAAVAGCTIFSLALQASVLGAGLSDIAHSLGHSSAWVVLRVAVHGIPELTGIFLPLAACLILTWRKAYNQMAAATMVCAMVAVPMIFASAAIEVWLTRYVF